MKTMTKKWKREHFYAGGTVFLLLFLMLVCPVIQTQAAEKKLVLNHTKVTMVCGKSAWLRATLYPKTKKKTEMIWKSTAPDVVAVSQNGKIKAKKAGTAKIVVKTPDGCRAVCKVTSLCYQLSGNRVTVKTEAGKRTYRRYNQISIRNGGHGCVITALAIAASGFGKEYSPDAIQLASSSKKYGELYAVRKLGLSTSLHLRAAISVRTANEILNNMGIPGKAVYRFSKKKAIQDIAEHLREGKPVIVKTNKTMHNGIRMANGHHAVVLVAIDEDDCVTFINPIFGKMNYCHAAHSKREVRIKLEDLVTWHMTQATKEGWKKPYVTSINDAGGYILVG